MLRERTVGEVFKMSGVEVVVVPDAEGINGCELCVICDKCQHAPPNILETGECVGELRSDGIGVHFERHNDGHNLTRHLDGDKKSPIATDREQ